MAPPLLALRDIQLTFGSTPLLTGADMAGHARAQRRGPECQLNIAQGEKRRGH
ncbi:MAG: hypothetical protein AAFO61_14825 [Pseudomonadota bacterium]